MLARLKTKISYSALSLMAGVVLCGCAKSTEIAPVKNHVVTAKETDSLMESIKDETGLTVDEVRLLIVRRMRAAFHQLGSQPAYPEGQTVGQIIEIERAAEAETLKKQAEEKAQKAQAEVESATKLQIMQSALSGRVTGKGFKLHDFNKGELFSYVTLKATFENCGTKPIKAFKGSFKLTSQLGELIQEASLSCDNLPRALKPDENFEAVYSFQNNEYVPADIKFKDTTLKNMKVEWIPTVILFADGTKLDLEEE